MKKLIVFFSLFILFIGCESEKEFDPIDRKQFETINETKIVEIELEGPASLKDAELSGLTWHNDDLILLPQFPFKFGDGLNGSVFYIPKSKLQRYLFSGNTNPIKPGKIKFIADGLEQFNRWGSGYEAITFVDDTVFVAIESLTNPTIGYTVRGLYDRLNRTITLDSETLVENEFTNRLVNHAEETITVFEDKLLVMHESNGMNVFTNPYALLINPDLKNYSKIGIPQIEYRVTDATRVASDSTFWIINYLWGGDTRKLKPENDSLFIRYGIGKSHKNNFGIERLVKMKIKKNKIIFADDNPIYLELPDNRSSRNWEGIVEFQDKGFLLVTDRHPKTILAYVPF